MKRKRGDRFVLMLLAMLVVGSTWLAPWWFRWHWHNGMEIQPFWLGLLIVALPGAYLTQPHQLLTLFQLFLLGLSVTTIWYWQHLYQIHIAQPWLNDSLNSERLLSLAWHYFQADWYRLVGWTALSLGLAVMTIILTRRLNIPKWGQSAIAIFTGMTTLMLCFQTTGRFITDCHPNWLCFY